MSTTCNLFPGARRRHHKGVSQPPVSRTPQSDILILPWQERRLEITVAPATACFRSIPRNRLCCWPPFGSLGSVAPAILGRGAWGVQIEGSQRCAFIGKAQRKGAHLSMLTFLHHRKHLGSVRRESIAALPKVGLRRTLVSNSTPKFQVVRTFVNSRHTSAVQTGDNDQKLTGFGKSSRSCN